MLIYTRLERVCVGGVICHGKNQLCCSFYVQECVISLQAARIFALFVLKKPENKSETRRVAMTKMSHQVSVLQLLHWW